MRNIFWYLTAVALMLFVMMAVMLPITMRQLFGDSDTLLSGERADHVAASVIDFIETRIGRLPDFIYGLVVLTIVIGGVAFVLSRLFLESEWYDRLLAASIEKYRARNQAQTEQAKIASRRRDVGALIANLPSTATIMQEVDFASLRVSPDDATQIKLQAAALNRAMRDSEKKLAEIPTTCDDELARLSRLSATVHNDMAAWSHLRDVIAQADVDTLAERLQTLDTALMLSLSSLSARSLNDNERSELTELRLQTGALTRRVYRDGAPLLQLVEKARLLEAEVRKAVPSSSIEGRLLH